MNTSPITTWEGATAYFTFADSPAMLAIILVLAVAACLYAIGSMVSHENAASKKLNGK
ncbi:hypothetical protein ABUE31_20710 [Mesorhizobium sp. ZMM04-5]|uniref:Uncharacterized protein n=1 Tax=Mesorhizobium marinum TaxID=3228790 RepID=A0ABV3R5S8_9HYPH